jgi:hypothetical protein
MRRSILTQDQEQLKHIDAKLAELTALPPAEQARMQCLIDALHRGKTELLRSFGRSPRSRFLAA